MPIKSEKCDNCSFLIRNAAPLIHGLKLCRRCRDDYLRSRDLHAAHRMQCLAGGMMSADEVRRKARAKEE